MFPLISASNNAPRHAAQLLVTILTILLIGKLISLLPVMQKLELFNTFRAAEIIWFLARFTALCVFYFFARHAMDAIPVRRGAMMFLLGISEPLTALIIVILAQDLFWQLLAPFVNTSGRSMYYGSAILLILGVSVWLVMKAYRHANDLIDTLNETGNLLSRFNPHNTVICGQCNAEISSKSQFCDKCGHNVQQPRSCSECGVTVTEGQKYCQNCGATLSESITREAP